MRISFDAGIREEPKSFPEPILRGKSGDVLALADDDSQYEGYCDGDQHGDGEGTHGLGLHGQDAGQTADTDGVCGGGGHDGEDTGDTGTDHGADEGEVVLQVDTEHGGLGNTQVAGDAGGNVDFLSAGVLALQVDHTQNGGALSDVGQSDHGPQHGAAEVSAQLGVDGVGHVVQTGDNQGSVEGAEDSAEDGTQGTGDTGVDEGGDEIADDPADGAQDEVSSHDSQQQAAEGNHDHGDHSGSDLAEELLQVDQSETGQHGGDDLSLIADHFNLNKAEVPDGDLGGAGNAVSIQQLAGAQGQTQNDAQHLVGAHLLGDGPADTDRQHVEDGFADQPQEVVNTGPELAQLYQSGGAACEDVQAVDDVAEAQNQTACDDCGNQGCEDFCQSGHDTLQSVLVLLGCGLGLVLADAFDAGNGGEVVVEVSDGIADDDLELTGLGEAALNGRDSLDCLDVCQCGIVQHEAHTGHAVADCCDVFLATNQLQQLGGILGVLAHDSGSSCIFLFLTCLNKFLMASLYHTCLNKSIRKK